jgi:hypothetical protein
MARSSSSGGAHWRPPSARNIGQTIGTPGTPGSDVDATLAWDAGTGSKSIVVAVVDTGIDYWHSDLFANIWTATAPFTVNVGGSTITCGAGTHGFNAINNTERQTARGLASQALA